MAENAEDTQALVTLLGEQAQTAFYLALDGRFNETERKSFLSKGEELSVLVDILSNEIVESNTQGFMQSAQQLSSVNQDIQAAIEQLSQAVETVKLVTSILALLDQVIAIAAGLLKTA